MAFPSSSSTSSSSSKHHVTVTFVFSISIIVFFSHVNAQFTSIFSFGDSLTDTGNSLQLSRLDSRNLNFEFSPYGRTFFHHPTGRCSDGRLIIDFMAEGVGLRFVPPYFGESKNFGKGVNFAVAGATALGDAFFKERGILIPTNVSLEVQLGFFKHVLASLCSSSQDCKELLRKSLIVMGEIGGNDYNHAFMFKKNIEEIREFVPSVVHTIGSVIKELIELGAITILVPGNFPIGCSPLYLTKFQTSNNEEYDPSTGCITWLNQFSMYHNELLQKLLDQIRNSHPNVNILYADYFNITMRFYQSPTQFGFKEILIACCGGGGPYNQSSSVICGDPLVRSSCDYPSSYVSWDGLHYTEAAYRWISKIILQQLFSIHTNSGNLCNPLTYPIFNCVMIKSIHLLL